MMATDNQSLNLKVKHAQTRKKQYRETDLDGHIQVLKVPEALLFFFRVPEALYCCFQCT